MIARFTISDFVARVFSDVLCAHVNPSNDDALRANSLHGRLKLSRTHEFNPPAPVVVLSRRSIMKQCSTKSVKATGLSSMGSRMARPMYAVDLRNHGASPHVPKGNATATATSTIAATLQQAPEGHGPMASRALAGDLVRFMDDHDLDTAMLVGHGLGGTAAMATALFHGDRVDRLMVVDTCTTPPPNGGLRWVAAAMATVPLAEVKTRSDADALLKAAGVADVAMRQFALQNLVIGAAEKQASWRVNLDALLREDTDAGLQLDDSDTACVVPYDGDVLFLVGATSDHVDVTEARSAVHPLFPHARFESLEGGHWLHLEKPVEFVSQVMRFVDGTPADTS